MDRSIESLSEKMLALTPNQLTEVEEFISSLQAENHDVALSRAAASASEPSFAAVWSNPEDDVYDAL